MNNSMTTVKRNSRSAVHYLGGPPPAVTVCGATNNHVQSRSGGATIEAHRVTCELCQSYLATLVP